MAHARTASRGGDGARIGSGARIRGRIAGDGDLTIAGQVEGDIALRGNLTIEDGATATSDVEAHDVTIAGALEGTVNASGHVKIASGARVRGDVRGTGLEIEEGAQYAGRLDSDFELPSELQEARGGRR
jgi:cytoskeletal protein CcmA (bactofilin family)